MGPLFWRFFWFFWLAQAATSLAVGATVWLLRPMAETPIPLLLQPPPQPPTLFPLLMPIGIGGIISLGFAAAMASYVMRPIRRLDLAFRSIAEGRLDERIGAALGGANNELTALGAGFDRMAERLQALVDSQRRLLHDVSHEMRAPLTRLQIAADLMEKVPERQAEMRARLHADVERMTRLVNELLTLARLENEGSFGQREKISLHELLDAVAGDAKLDAAQKHSRIEVEYPKSVELTVHHELLHRAIDNVVRNAVRHAPEASRITLRASVEGREVQIAVEDQGIGVADGDLEAIFDPFVRGAKHSPDGYGLGLAITRRAIEAHGGKVTASNLAEGGFRVRMTIPMIHP